MAAASFPTAPHVSGPRPIRFLASVVDADEARLAMAGGADIVDAKDPAAGALGALAPRVVAAIRRALPAAVPLSATIGDLAPDIDVWRGPILALAGAGAGYVKIGIFPGRDARGAVRAAGRLDIGGARLVGVLLADREPDLALIAAMADAGFAGVLLDTAGKSGRRLTDLMPLDRLAAFVAAAHAAGLLAGLAGSLDEADIAPLAACQPDILGFRGALAAGQQRTAGLDPMRVAAVREAIDRANADDPARAAPVRLASTAR